MNIFVEFGINYITSESSGFWLSLFVTLIGTFSGFLLALYVDRLTHSRNRKLKREEELNRKIDRLKYLQSVLSAVVEYIPKQTTSLKKYAEVQLNKPYEIVQPEILATFDFQRLSNCDSSDMQESYTFLFKDSENPYKDYKLLFAHADYLLREFLSLEKRIELATKFKHSDQKLIGDIIDELGPLVAEFMKDLANQGKSDSEEYITFKEIAVNYEAIIGNMLVFDEARMKFIIPLLEATIGDGGEKRKIEIFKLARKANNLFGNIKANSDQFAHEMEQYELTLSESREHLLSQINKLNKILSK